MTIRNFAENVCSMFADIQDSAMPSDKRELVIFTGDHDHFQITVTISYKDDKENDDEDR